VAISRALRRLLQVRHLEEEQARLALESAASELHRLENALATTGQRGLLGRKLFADSTQTGDLFDRVAGLEESSAAARTATILAAAAETVHTQAEDAREEYLSVRIERRQAETLIQEAEEQEGAAAARRAQQDLDEWYRPRARRKASID
jgi:flagellar biosynthesis chaperone FliJ